MRGRVWLRGQEEAAEDRLHGRPDQGARGRVREEQVPFRVQEDAALEAAQAHRDTGIVSYKPEADPTRSPSKL